MMDNKKLITDFYNYFAAGDADGMASCYADDVQFEDPAFGPLFDADVKNMWRMLLKGNQVRVEASDIQADEKTGSANWVATYNFSKTGRKVINNVSAQFEFKNGKISRHIDSFNMWKWAGQALGIKGYLLGWTALLKNSVRKQALARLAKFKG